MDTKELTNKLKSLLAEHLGVEVSDIGNDDDFTADLQMEPTSVFDFQEKLASAGFGIDNDDFQEMHCIDDLVDALEGAVPDHSGHESDN